jgi:hypothetical protein
MVRKLQAGGDVTLSLIALDGRCSSCEPATTERATSDGPITLVATVAGQDRRALNVEMPSRGEMLARVIAHASTAAERHIRDVRY